MRASTLRLSQQQETDLVEYLFRRFGELDKDNRERIAADKASDLEYRLSKEKRATEGVFQHSNFPVPLTSWVVDHFSARTEEEVLGRDPFTQFKPQGPSDTELARSIDRCTRYKFFTQGTVKKDLQDGVLPIFKHRSAIFKSVYKEDFNEWEEYDLPALYDVTTGRPVEILGHGFILQGQSEFEPQVDLATGSERYHLKADPTFIYDQAKHVFAPLTTPVRMKQRTFAAPKSMAVDGDAFRCPSDARSLDEADIIVEYYDKPYSWILDRFTERPWFKRDDLDGLLRDQTASRKTDGKRKEASTESLDFDRLNGRYGMAECWIERDVLGWGRPQRIVVWVERKTRRLITAEFSVKVTPGGRQPYTAISIWKQDNLWWGYSIPEMLKPIQHYVDLQFNRHSYRNSINTTPIVGEHPDAIAEQVSFADLKPFQVVTLEEGKRMSDWIETFVFPNADHDTQELIDKAIYWVNFWLGISNIARGDYSDVPQNTTASGQEATLREASKLSRRWTRRVIDGYTEHLTKLARLFIVTMDPEEVFTFLEGDVEKVGVLLAAQAQDLDIDARLIFSSDQTTRTLEINRLSLEIVEKYANYLVASPWIIPMVRPLMKSSLYLLGHDNVDELLPLPPGLPLTPPLMMPAINQPQVANGEGSETASPAAPAPAPGQPASPAPVPASQPSTETPVNAAA